MKVEARSGFDGLAQSHVARQGDDGDAAPRDRGLYGNFKHARHLFGLRNQFTIMAALRKEMLRVGLLKVCAADFVAWNLRGDGEHRNTAAVAVVESVDQVEISGTATAGANRQPAGKMSLSARGKSCCFFMAQMNPIQFSGGSDRLGNAVEGIAGDAVNPAHPGLCQNINQQICYFFLRHYGLRTKDG